MIQHKIPEISIAEADNALRGCLNALRKNVVQFRDSFEEQTAPDGLFSGIQSLQQLGGLWPGELWLGFGLTGEREFRSAAEQLVPYFTRHAAGLASSGGQAADDAGFLYSPACVGAFKNVKNNDAREAALAAAAVLASRFRAKGNFIQMSGADGDPHGYSVSIRSLMAMPLLFWARDEDAKQEYRDMAKAHLKTVTSCCIPEGGPVFGTFYINPADGTPVAGSSGAEFSVQSVPAYLQAEALLALALCYRYDRQADYLQSFRRLLSFYKSRLPSDMIPFWDMNVTDGEESSRDTAAAAIAACALLQMSENYCADVSDDETFSWRRNAKRMLKVLASGYAVRDFGESNGFLYSGLSGVQGMQARTARQCTLLGDYFYLEALCRLRSPHFVNCW